MMKYYSRLGYLLFCRWIIFTALLLVIWYVVLWEIYTGWTSKRETSQLFERVLKRWRSRASIGTGGQRHQQQQQQRYTTAKHQRPPPPPPWLWTKGRPWCMYISYICVYVLYYTAWVWGESACPRFPAHRRMHIKSDWIVWEQKKKFDDGATHNETKAKTGRGLKSVWFWWRPSIPKLDLLHFSFAVIADIVDAFN